MPEGDGRERRPEPPVGEPPAKPRRGLLKLGLIALATVAGVGLWYWLAHRNRQSTDDAQVDGHIAPISPRVAGNVFQVLVDIGRHVTAGQVLVRLDPRDYQARVDQAEAALASAEADADAAKVGVPLTRAATAGSTSGAAANLASKEASYQQAQVEVHEAATSGIAVAQADVATAQANYQKAQADLDRMRPLAAKQEISQQQYDTWLAVARVAAAELSAARERLAAARQNAADKQAAAQAAQARANLEAAELDLSYTSILAPVTGEVTAKTVEPGQTVQPGQQLMAVVPLRETWVTANFKETWLAHVHPGQRAEVKVDMYGKTIDGRVDSIGAATGSRLSLMPPENATGNFVKVVERIPVKIVFDRLRVAQATCPCEAGFVPVWVLPQRIPVKIVFDRLPPGVVLRPCMNVEATIVTK